MKNFKKVLALVLVVATLMSFATIASAASEDYKDGSKIEHVEAVDVLSAIGVLAGYTDGDFKPERVINRAEAAKIIAMFDNGDTDIDELYAPVSFTDVEAGHWAESFISYCYHTGIVAGMGNNTFAPSADVTGVQFLKMVLIVLGFDAEKEGLLGAGWAVATRKLALKCDLLYGLGKDFDYTDGLTRDDAAQIMLNALLCDTVEYGRQIGIVDDYYNYARYDVAFVTETGAVSTGDKLYEEWNLYYADVDDDPFGRPAYAWYYADIDFPFQSEKYLIGKYAFEPVATYTTRVDGCTVYDDLGIDLDEYKFNYDEVFNAQFESYTDGVPGTEYIADQKATNKNDSDELKEGTYTGAQGQLTEVYEFRGRFDKINSFRIVHINTYLAKVTLVRNKAEDNKGHVQNLRNVWLNVYADENDPDHATIEMAEDNVDYASYEEDDVLPYIISNVKPFVTDEFSKGDYVLVNGYTNDNGDFVPAIVEEAETQEGRLTGMSGLTAGGYTNMSIDGDKTPIAYKYDYRADRDSSDIWKDFTFFFDAYGNVIGSTDYLAAANYAVIDKIYIEYEKGDVVAYATLVKPNGDKIEDVEIDKFITEDGKLNAEELFSLIDDMDGEFELEWAGSGIYQLIGLYARLVSYSETKNGAYNIDFTYRKDHVVTDLTLDNERYLKDENGRRVLKLSTDTVVLIQNTDAPNARYTSYVGYDELPKTLEDVNLTVEYVGETDDVEFLFARVDDETDLAKSEKFVYWYDEEWGYEVDADDEEDEDLIFSYPVQTWNEDGALVDVDPLTYKGDANIFAQGTGIYEVIFNGDGTIYTAAKPTQAEGTLLTGTGMKRVYEYDGEEVGEIEVLDLNEIPFRNLFESDEYDQETVGIEDLHGEKVYLIMNEDEEVIICYFMEFAE